MRVTDCKRDGCGAPIIWCQTAAGKRMPLDADPAPWGGNVSIWDPEASTPLVRVLKKGEKGAPGEQLYRAHFQSCKGAKPAKKKPASRGNAGSAQMSG